MKKITSNYVKVPLAGVIFFSLLLAGTSFFSGYTYLKYRGGGQSTASTASAATFNTTKTDRPELKFFVMSFCPYGNQMEEILRPVFDLLGSKIDIRPQYIFDKVEGDLDKYCQTTSPDPKKCDVYVQNSNGQLKDIKDCESQIAKMVAACNDPAKYLKIGNNYYNSLHGRIEANQDVREICAWNLATDKKLWWDFVANVNKNCNQENADTCWEDQAKKAGFDAAKISECFNTQAGELIEKEIALTKSNNITGSPTLLLGDKAFPPQLETGKTSVKIGKKVFTQDQFRTAAFIKEALCASFKKEPKECQKEIKLPAADAAPAPAANAGCGS